MTEVVLPMLLEPALKGAAGSAMGAVVKRALERVSVSGQKSASELIDEATRNASRSLLGILDDLPPGLALSDVIEALNSLEAIQTIRELIYVELTGKESRHKSFLRKRLALHVTRLTSGSRELGAAVATRVQSYVEDISAALLKSVKSADETGKLLNAIQCDTILNATITRCAQGSQGRKRFADPDAYESLLEWEDEYRSAVSNDHGYLEPPDAEMKRKVPIDSLYVPSKISSPDSGLPDDIDSTQVMSMSDRVVLLGDPGGGKSTAARYVSQAHARDRAARVPFTVVLRDFATGGTMTRSVVQYLEEQAATLYQVPPPEYGIDYVLASGRALVIFDGLDELVRTEDRREVTRRVELFLSKYPAVTALVTSRRVGYDQARLDPEQFSVAHLEGFDEPAVRAYVVKWFEVVGMGGTDLERDVESFIAESEGLPDLTVNPLMLALMCIIYRGQGYLPRNRTDVYEQCAKLLFEKWDTSRKIHVELKARSQIDSAIKHLAYWMLSERGGVEAVTERDLLTETSEYLKKVFSDADERQAAAAEFVNFCTGRAWVFSDAGTTGEGQRLFKFTHRTFMEFFAAYQITRLHDAPEAIARLLMPHIIQEEWEVIAQLVVQLAHKHSESGGDRILTKLLDDGRRRRLESRERIHAFSWTCLAYVVVHPDTAKRLARISVRDTVTRLARNSTIANRVRFNHGATDYGSLAFALGVLPEVRAEVLDVVFDAIGDEWRGVDPDRAHIGALLGLSGFIAMSAVPEEGALQWREASLRYARENLTPLLAASGREGMHFALTRRLLTVREGLEREGSVRSLYVALNTDLYIACYGVRFVSWSGGIWRRVARDSSPGESLLSALLELEEAIPVESSSELANVLDAVPLMALHDFSSLKIRSMPLPRWGLFLALAPSLEYVVRREPNSGSDRFTLLRSLIGDWEESLGGEQAAFLSEWAAHKFSFLRPDVTLV